MIVFLNCVQIIQNKLKVWKVFLQGSWHSKADCYSVISLHGESEIDFCSCIKITTLLMLQHLFVQYNTFHLCTCKGNNCDTFICIVQKIQCLLSNKHVYYVQNIYWISTQWFCLFCDLEWILFIFCCVTSRFVSPLFCVNQVTKFGSE